jgi:hypothetical protein
MTESLTEVDIRRIQELNEKAIQNQFFVPDHVYIDLGLFKDIPLGIVYADQIALEDDENQFNKIQAHMLSCLSEYQKRTYDTINPHLKQFGYTNKTLDSLLENKDNHDLFFMMAPATTFLHTLIRHTVRNQNNSRPANKYTKKVVGDKQFLIEPIPVTYVINTYPLTLSVKVIEEMSAQLGEALGVNIRVICKDPATFDKTDWDDWLEAIECFYIDSLGRFTESDFIRKCQADMDFVGRWLFARKRFESKYIGSFNDEEFDQQVQMITSHMDVFFEFSWLQNNDVRLTEEADDVPVEEPSPTE